MADRARQSRAGRLTTIGLCLVAGVALGLLLSGCGSSTGPTEGSPVTGTVTYRERIALPDGALVIVQILDVSLTDAPARVIGEQVIHPGRGQVPVSYAVPYAEKEIDERRSYFMSARIEDGEGNALFISDTAVPVITQDDPTKNVQIVVVPVDLP